MSAMHWNGADNQTLISIVNMSVCYKMRAQFRVTIFETNWYWYIDIWLFWFDMVCLFITENLVTKTFLHHILISMNLIILILHFKPNQLINDYHWSNSITSWSVGYKATNLFFNIHGALMGPLNHYINLYVWCPSCPSWASAKYSKIQET